MKKLFIKTIYISSLISLVYSLVFMSITNFNLNEFGMFMNMESNVLLKVLSFLFIFIFFTFIFLIFALVIEMPFYVWIWLKRLDNTVAYKYKDSGDSIYNRDLPKYNSAMAGYLVDYITDAKQDYIALFIELIGKKLIKMDYEGNKLGEDINKSTDTIKLKTSELFVINTYKKYKELTISDFQTFRKIIQTEAIEAGYIKNNSSAIDVIDKLYAFYSEKFSDPKLALVCTVYGIFLIMLLLFVLIPIPFNFLMILGLVLLFRFKFNMNRYTKLGKEEKEKMAKFRKFMKNQTTLAEKNINDRNFEKFIPYAIAFNVNNIYQQKIENMLKKLK